MTRKPSNPTTVLRGIGGAGVSGEQLADAAEFGAGLAGVGHGYENAPEESDNAQQSTEG